MIRKMNSVAWLGVLLLALMFTACTKQPLNDLTQEESRIYITNYDDKADFSSYQTFSVSDSVTVINNGQAERKLTTSDQAFINALRAQMTSRGYTEVAKNSNPDVALNVSRIYNTATGIISYNNYWNDYYGYYDPYYWGYPGYGYYSPYAYQTYTIREGALSIDMLDLKNAGTSNQIEGIWSGLIRGSGIFDANTASSQVQQLFAQSPYLRNE